VIGGEHKRPLALADLTVEEDKTQQAGGRSIGDVFTFRLCGRSRGPQSSLDERLMPADRQSRPGPALRRGRSRGPPPSVRSLPKGDRTVSSPNSCGVNLSGPARVRESLVKPWGIFPGVLVRDRLL